MLEADNQLSHVKQLAIVGVGLMGGSIGTGLRLAGFSGKIIGVGRRRESLDIAMRHRCVDAVTTNLGDAVCDSDMVIVAVNLGVFAQTFQCIAEHDHDGLIITDVGSTKMQVVADARRHLPDMSRFVGAHPMAGSEHRGPSAARPDLFADKPCIITPEADTDDDAAQTVAALWRLLQMRVIFMSPKEHDEKSAAISHLPHAAAAMLVHIANRIGGLEIASTGFRDTTRLASSNPPMRADIMTANRDALLHALDVLEQQINTLRGALSANEHDKLMQWLEQAKRTRDDWDHSA